MTAKVTFEFSALAAGDNLRPETFESVIIFLLLMTKQSIAGLLGLLDLQFTTRSVQIGTRSHNSVRCPLSNIYCSIC